MAKLIQLPNSRPANPSEAQVVQVLVDRLPNTYTVIPNAEIAQAGGPPFEYDVIVIAPHAVYVVEAKRWLGGIQGDDFTWLVAGIHHRPNPWLTANNKARVIKNAIEGRLPGLGRFWTEAVVAIVDDQGSLNLRGKCRERVFHLADLPAFLMDAAALAGKAGDLRPQRAHLETAVQQAARGRQSGPLQYGSYKVIETLSRRDLVSEFLARNLLLPDSPPVRLRVFSYNPYLPADQLESHKASLRREAEALQKIGYHPNLITLRSFEASPEDPNLLLEITDWSESGALRALMSTEPLSLERKLELALGITAGLKAAHNAGVIHRDLRPENVLIGGDGEPRLMNFEHARLEASGAYTVGLGTPEPGIPQAYIAPELSLPNPLVKPSVDLYSLGMILFELLVGKVLHESPHEALTKTDACSSPLAYVSDVPPDLNTLVCDLLQLDPARRPQTAQEVWDRLRGVKDKPSGTVLPIEPPKPPEPEIEESEPAVFKVGQLIDGKYEVQKKLAEGGFGQVYRVYDGILDEVFALKIFSNASLSLSALQVEAGALAKLSHPNIVKVRNWGRLAQSGRFYMVSEFVEGEEIARFTDPDQRLSVREVVQIIIDLLGALEYLHPKVDRMAELREMMRQGEIGPEDEEYKEYGKLEQEGWLHRDIKPNNLILSTSGVKLIDFNIAARASQAGITLTGTPGYMLPSVGFMRWNTEGDLFATAIVLYELVTGHHPYPDGKPGSDEATDPRIYVPELAPVFAELLLRAVSCADTEHYHSARRFRNDLLDLEEEYLQALPSPIGGSDIKLEPEEIGCDNYNPYVTRLLKLYSQAQRDNSGTRGLDEVARLTYVQTRLDRALQPAILDGQYRLVIVTGNAGDGKTAFIQSLEKEVEGLGGKIEHPTSNASRFQHRGLQFVANYDGSQDEGAERANDQVLSEFFYAFDDAHFVNVGAVTPVHLIAINEGRLVDFFSDLWMVNQDATSSAAQNFQQLGRCIQSYFEQNGQGANLPPWMLIVDLNQRSVIAPDPDQENASIFDRQLQAFLKPEFWQPCQACALQARCFIKYNVDTFSDPVSGPAVKGRVRSLFEIVHLRRQLHITMRDLRSALSWMLLRDQSCQDVAQQVKENPSPAKQMEWFYFNAFQGFAEANHSVQAEDRLVRLLRQIDPARVANPETDRILFYKGLQGLPTLAFDNRSTLVKDLLASWLLPTTWQAAQQPEKLQEHHQRHAYLRRLAFFERRDISWEQMLPYRHLDDFKQATQEQRPADLMSRVANAFSFVEGAHNPELVEGFVCIRAGQNVKTRVRSFRLFPLADFTIQIPPFQAGRYLEYTNHYFTFVHSPADGDQTVAGAQRATLTVSLDLIELLEEINEGYIPSQDDVSGIFINLLTFKNALAHLPYHRVLLTRDDKRYYELTQLDQARLRIQVWQPERKAGDEN